MTDDFIALLDSARLALGRDAVPDSETSRWALALALHATAAADSSDHPADWDMCAATVERALVQLTQGLDLAVAAGARHGLPSVGVDRPELRAATAAVLARLADLCANVAVNRAYPTARRLVWAELAHRLDAATRELL